jgi:hypothetical protein
MKRLIIVTTLLLAATSMSAWAQAPAADDSRNPPQTVAPAPAQATPPTAMPMTNCAGNHDSAVAQSEKTSCAMAPGDMKSDQGAMPMHQMMMQGMMHSQPQSGTTQPDQNQGGTTCCGSPKADKPQ